MDHNISRLEREHNANPADEATRMALDAARTRAGLVAKPERVILAASNSFASQFVGAHKVRDVTFHLVADGTVKNLSSYWDGGRRSTWGEWTPGQLRAAQTNAGGHPFFESGRPEVRFVLGPRWLIEWVSSGGHDFCYVDVPASAWNLVPWAPPPILSNDEICALGLLSYKGASGALDASKGKEGAAAIWNGLASKGLVKRAGRGWSLTAEGRMARNAKH